MVEIALTNEFRFGKGHDPKTCRICKELGITQEEQRPTKYALDAALVAPAEQLSNSVIVPADEVGSQPRQ